MPPFVSPSVDTARAAGRAVDDLFPGDPGPQVADPFVSDRPQLSAPLEVSERRFRDALDGVALHALILDLDGRMIFANRYHLAATGWAAEDLFGADAFVWLASEDEPDARRQIFRSEIAAGRILDSVETTWKTRSGEGILIAWTNSAIRDDEGRVVALSSVGEDVTARREAEAAQSRLIGAIDQAAETIIVTDAAARVVYANPAFSATSGYPVEDLLGRDLWQFLREAGASINRRLATRLRSGRSWSGEWALRRRDGVSYREEVTISPVRDPSGGISSFVCVGRDVSHLRAIQESLDATMRERVAFAHALARLEQRATPEETSQDLTDAMVELADIDIATVLSFEATGEVRVLAWTAPNGYPLAVGDTLPAGRAAHIRKRAANGAWSDQFTPLERDGEYATALAVLGLRAIASAPIGGSDGPIGIVAVGTTDERAARGMPDQLPAVIEFAAAARGLIAGPLATRNRLRASQERIRAVIAAGAFDPVFQPIVYLATGVSIGYEALTRFRDNRRPDLVFAEAGSAEVGLELEAATLERTLDAAQGLPVGPWLGLNVSAAMVLKGDTLARLLKRRTRPIVLEITEHDPIADYQAVRAAVALLGPDVRLAVDDAGAGVANFTHIVELRPDFVKIDASLVAGVNSDLTRQALIVGLHHFAQATNGWVIAEGVETEEERQSLIGLDVVLGQGYLFGRPADVETWPSPAARIRPDDADRCPPDTAGLMAHVFGPAGDSVAAGGLPRRLS